MFFFNEMEIDGLDTEYEREGAGNWPTTAGQ